MLRRDLRIARLAPLAILLGGCSHRPATTPASAAPVSPAHKSAERPSSPPKKTHDSAPTEPELCIQHTGGVFQSGYASWYGARLAGHPTASGERFDPSKLTAAHRTLPLGTWVKVRRTDDGRTVTVRINDRGPVSHRFCIDLSSGAARELHMLRMGVAPVEIRIVPRR